MNRRSTVLGDGARLGCALLVTAFSMNALSSAALAIELKKQPKKSVLAPLPAAIPSRGTTQRTDKGSIASVRREGVRNGRRDAAPC